MGVVLASAWHLIFACPPGMTLVFSPVGILFSNKLNFSQYIDTISLNINSRES